MRKTQSWAERMSSELPPLKCDLSFDYQTLGQENQEFEGRVMTVTKLVTKDWRDGKKEYKVTDFCLENIIASGATDMLKQVSFMRSALEETDHIENILSQLKNVKENG